MPKKIAKKGPAIEDDEDLIKILRYIGWTFAVFIVGVIGLIGIQALFYDGGLMDGISEELSIYKITIVLVSLIGCGLCFATSAEIKRNIHGVKEAMKNFYVSSVLIGLIAIFVIAFAQPIPWT